MILPDEKKGTMQNLSEPRKNSLLKEQIVFPNEQFNYSIYSPKSDAQFCGDILWHWHDEFEFGYVIEGTLLYKTDIHEYVLQKGDAIFINSGVLHYL